MSTPTPYPPSKHTPRPFHSISPAPHHTSSPVPFSLPQIYKSPLKQAGNTAHNTPTPAGFGSSPLAQLEGRGRGAAPGTKSSTSNEEPPPAVLAGGSGLALREISDTALSNVLDVSALVATGTEEERIHRTATILQLLGPWGSVSQEGVERCVQRLGLEWTWEDGVGATSVDDRERTLSIAGSHLLIEIKWMGDAPQKVSLEFPDAGDWAEKSATKAADILLHNLTCHPPGRSGYLMLDAFAENLARLANLDKLGREGISCFRAIEGLYSSFRKIWEYELDRASGSTQGEDDQDTRERDVLCQRTGRPQVHVGDQVGFRLAYWTDRRLLTTKRNADEMDLDDDSQPRVRPHSRPRSRPRASSRSYHLLVDCEASPSSQYPSVRLSESWVSEAVGKETSAAEVLITGEKDTIDWVDPPPTLLPLPTSSAMDLDSSLLDQQSRFPNVRFIAHLDPPITVPLPIAVQLFNLVGSPLMQESVHSTSYTFLTLEKASAKAPRNRFPEAIADDVLPFHRSVRSYHNGVCKEHTHHYRLFTQHNGWARTIDRIPFSHPKQLALILPVLRQWAFVESLLKRTLGTDEEPPPQKTKSTDDRRPSTPPSDTDVNVHAEDESAQATNGLPPPRVTTVDLTLILDVVPTLAIICHPGTDNDDDDDAAAAPAAIQLRFQIEPNAELVLEEAQASSANDSSSSSTQAASKRRERVLRALSLCEDVGVLLEWMNGAKGANDANDANGAKGRSDAG